MNWTSRLIIHPIVLAVLALGGCVSRDLTVVNSTENELKVLVSIPFRPYGFFNRSPNAYAFELQPGQTWRALAADDADAADDQLSGHIYRQFIRVRALKVTPSEEREYEVDGRPPLTLEILGTSAQFEVLARDDRGQRCDVATIDLKSRQSKP